MKTNRQHYGIKVCEKLLHARQGVCGTDRRTDSISMLEIEADLRETECWGGSVCACVIERQ